MKRMTTPEIILLSLQNCKPLAEKLAASDPSTYSDLKLSEEEQDQYLNFLGAMAGMSHMTGLAKRDYGRTDKEIFKYFRGMREKAGLSEAQFKAFLLYLKALGNSNPELDELLLQLQQYEGDR